MAQKNVSCEWNARKHNHNGYGYSLTVGIFRIFFWNSSFARRKRKILKIYQNQLVIVEATENDRMSGGISSIFYYLELQIIVEEMYSWAIWSGSWWNLMIDWSFFFTHGSLKVLGFFLTIMEVARTSNSEWLIYFVEDFIYIIRKMEDWYFDNQVK